VSAAAPDAPAWRLALYQIATLAFVVMAGTAVLSLPLVLTTYAGQDAWLAALLASPVGLVPLALLYLLERQAPGLTLAEHARRALGRALGGALALAWALFLATTLPVVVREFADLVRSEALPRTPEPVVLGLLLLVPTYMARQGAEPIARVAGVLTPLAAVALVVIFLPSLGAARLEHLLPVWALGWRAVLQAAAPAAAFYGETALLGFVLPFRGGSMAGAWAAAALGLGAVAVTVAAATAWALLVFGPLTAVLPNTLFQVTRAASVAEFVTHLDALFIGVWLAGGLVKLALWLFCTTVSLAQALGLPDYRALSLPVAAFGLVAGCAWFPSSGDVVRWIERAWPFWGLAFELGVPLVVVAGALLRRPAGRVRRP
jgi:spore germination protein KB